MRLAYGGILDNRCRKDKHTIRSRYLRVSLCPEQNRIIQTRGRRVDVLCVLELDPEIPLRHAPYIAFEGTLTRRVWH